MVTECCQQDHSIKAIHIVLGRQEAIMLIFSLRSIYHQSFLVELFQFVDPRTLVDVAVMLPASFNHAGNSAAVAYQSPTTPLLVHVACSVRYP